MSDPSSSSSRPRASGATTTEPGSGRRSSLFGWLWQRDRSAADLKQIIDELVEAAGEGNVLLTDDQRDMLENLLAIGELQVDDVMVPRADIIAVDIAVSLDQLVATFREARHSRLPVYREALDEIVGYVHLKDVIDHWSDGANFRLADSLHKLIAVPPAMPVLELLQRMRASRQHMAVVVDEYGGTDGLVTIEDVVEQIVGDIDDEHDDDEPQLVEKRDGVWEVDGRLEIETFEQSLGLDLLPDDIDDEIDTLGGLVFHLMGRVPRRGDTIDHAASGLRFEVADADARRVKRLLVSRIARPAAVAAAPD
jgi:CBS domain containing-hemolysin-like protein